MALVYDHLGRSRFAIREEREAAIVGGGVDVDGPEPVNVDAGKVTVGRSVEYEIATFVSVSESRTLSIVGGGVNVQGPEPVTVDGGAESVERSVSMSSNVEYPSIEKGVSVTRTLSIVGGGVTVDEPDDVTVDGGTESVTRSVSLSSGVEYPSINKDVSVSRTPSIVGGGVTVDEPEGVEVNGGSESVGRSVSISKNVEGGNDPPNATLSSSSSGNTITWDATGSTDPNGDELTFYFDYGANGTTNVTNSTGIASQRVRDGSYTCQVTVEDTKGATDTATSFESVI